MEKGEEEEEQEETALAFFSYQSHCARPAGLGSRVR